jgi:hypothetical protein
MNVLVFNHFFDLDIEAIEQSNPGHSLFVVPFLYFRSKASKILGDDIINGEVEAFGEPQNKEKRARWREESLRIFTELQSVFTFDCFVTPSDSFCYIRDFISHCQNANIPVLVLQKETTISPFTMSTHSLRIGKELPFISDKMLVCSSRQKQFWLNAGAAENLIHISGQPRFDVYADTDRQKNWQEIGYTFTEHDKVILFFSYDLDAYAPKKDASRQDSTWSELRQQTELALRDLAQEGYHILIKPHPQQRGEDEIRRLKGIMGNLWMTHVHWVDRISDARHLIINADCIVGFQTTGLYEAMLANKKVVYTHWTDAVHTYTKKLIPFWKEDAALLVAKSSEELKHQIRNGTYGGVSTHEARRLICIDHIGDIDGHASDRAWKAIEELVQVKPLKSAVKPMSGRCGSSLKAHFYLNLYRIGSYLAPSIHFAARLLSPMIPSLGKGSFTSTYGIRHRCTSYIKFWHAYVGSVKAQGDRQN